MTGMTNPLFLDFIRKQVAAGIPRPDIEKVLKTNGLSPEEIEEGFISADSSVSIRQTQTVPQADTKELANESARIEESIIDKDSSRVIRDEIWSKSIPSANQRSMITCLALFILLDTGILFTVNEALIEFHHGELFWLIMAGVMTAFVPFFYLENVYCAPRFSQTPSSKDSHILSLIRFRNLIFVLNMVPWIQLLGILALVVACIPWSITYISLMRKRFRVS